MRRCGGICLSVPCLSSTAGNHWSEAEMDIGSDGIGRRDWFDDRKRRRPSVKN